MNSFNLLGFGLRRGVLTFALALSLLLTGTQSKADTVYNSRAAFDAVTSGRTVITFDGHEGALNGLPLTIGSVTFASPNSGPAAVVTGNNINVNTPAYGGGTDEFLIVDYGSPDTINITLDSPGATAIGLNVGGLYGDPTAITLTLSDGTVEVLSSLSGDSAAAGSLNFVGFTSSTPITSLSIVYSANGTGNSFGAIDNFTFGDALPVVPVPEPSSLALLGAGIVGAAGAFRRRIFRD